VTTQRGSDPTRTTRFNGPAFREWWQSLTADEQQPFKDKARWEQMALTAVIAEWWPDVWADLKVTS
jgi:hypothetical protein